MNVLEEGMDRKEAIKTIVFLGLLLVLGVVMILRFSANTPAVELPTPTIKPPVEEKDICIPGRNAAPQTEEEMLPGISDATLAATPARYGMQHEQPELIILDDPAETEPPQVEATEEPQPIEEPVAAVNEEEVEMLACVIYQEAGGNKASDTARYMVGDVVLNRMESDEFPNTMREVLTQKGQYGTYYWTGIKWMDRAAGPSEAAAVQRAYDTARDILAGNHSAIYGQGYIWEAEFPQGADVIHIDNLYFGR